MAEQNLIKCEGAGRATGLVPVDPGFRDVERFPRRFSFDFLTYHDADGAPKVRVMYKGRQFGDDLTDNSPTRDGYGYHDVIHMAFAAVLGWSPLVRKMLGESERARRDSMKSRMVAGPSLRRRGCRR